ncbi:MAG: hypothetical protein CLLPBCKN_005832 [Chroococcidiopsis cubana SAG 39.79]|nr:hypothetical protein [Chroococcidiopsis cubana]MDZ4876412.1 hypothetical protein [Chroococcidiopsis cubana SAG 39.79]
MLLQRGCNIYSNNVWLGVLAAILAGGMVGLLHALLSVSWRVDQLVSGLAINLVTAGLTSFLARLIFSGGAQKLPGIGRSPFLG